MAQTVDDVASALANEAGEDFDSIDTREQYRVWVSDAVEEILGFGEWSFTKRLFPLTTIVGESTYTLNEAVDRITSVVQDTNGLELRYAPYEWLTSAAFDPTITGTPRRWFEAELDPGTTAPSIRLWPVPAGVLSYTVRAKLRQEPLVHSPTSGSPVIPLPPVMIQLIKSWVRAAYNDARDSEPGYLRWRARFERQLVQARDQYKTQPARRSRPRYTDVPQLPRDPVFDVTGNIPIP